MSQLTDKVIIAICCLAIYTIYHSNDFMIVIILIAISFGAFSSYFDSGAFHSVLFILYIALCFFHNDFIYFIPLILYSYLLTPLYMLCFVSLVPVILQFNYIGFQAALWLFIVFGMSILIKKRLVSYLQMKSDYLLLRDNTVELSNELEKKKRNLLIQHDEELHIATLTERNRIARDIHDNVGHLLSRGLLQLGAILTTMQDSPAKNQLSDVKLTLQSAMESIRTSVHDLALDPINLNDEMNKLVSSFTFCPIELQIHVDEIVDKKMKSTFLSITKEALSNIIKHSNATMVYVQLIEHPALYQLVIKDNGSIKELKSTTSTEKPTSYKQGLGLQSITERIHSLGGYVRFDKEPGFRVFITIPKS